MYFELDGRITLSNGTSFDDGPTLVWSSDHLGDGDHQFYLLIGSLPQNGSVAVDYFEYVLHFVTRYAFQ